MKTARSWCCNPSCTVYDYAFFLQKFDADGAHRAVCEQQLQVEDDLMVLQGKKQQGTENSPLFEPTLQGAHAVSRDSCDELGAGMTLPKSQARTHARLLGVLLLLFLTVVAASVGIATMMTPSPAAAASATASTLGSKPCHAKL